ncbi:class I SAM-dependent methyltransferase [Halorussus lipolyticus]|uniref:class I SAM-dependent methyltransferase n=1 Tax=Halorussus lipolyticus TaxID=3034024 RepID=UPI0023E84DE5|nr:class I SAM-dependent methyltransferase [Halorussus sp. DT80]
MADFETGFQAERDADFSWISPLGVESSLEQLLSYPEGRDDIDSIIDAGCGDGTLTAKLAERYPDIEVHGVDPVAEDIAEAEEKVAGLDNATVEEAYLDPEVHEADLVYAINMVQDTPDPAEVIEQIHDTLREGGEAIVTAPTTGTEDLFVDPSPKYPHTELTEYDDHLVNDLGYVRGEVHYGDELIEQKLYATPDEGDESLVLSQYTIEPETVERFCCEAGFEIAETDSLVCNPAAITYFMDFFNYAEELDEWRDRTQRFQDDPESVDDDELLSVYTLVLRA